MTFFTDRQLVDFVTRRVGDLPPEDGLSHYSPLADYLRSDMLSVSYFQAGEVDGPGSYIDQNFSRTRFRRGLRRAHVRMAPPVKLTTPYDDDAELDDDEPSVNEPRAKKFFQAKPVDDDPEPDALVPAPDPEGLREHLGQSFLTGTVFRHPDTEHDSNAMDWADDDTKPLYRYFLYWLEQDELEWYDAVLLELAAHGEMFTKWVETEGGARREHRDADEIAFSRRTGFGLGAPDEFEFVMYRLGLSYEFIDNAYAIRRVFEHIDDLAMIGDHMAKAFPQAV